MRCLVALALASCLLLALAALPALASPPQQDAYYRPQVCLNGEWQFQPADNALSFPPPDNWDPVPIRIPSAWDVNAFSRGNGGDFNCFPSYPRSWESVVAAWHRRSFTPPLSMRGKAVFLRFEAVSFAAEVYVNGKHAGSHEGMFTPFELDVTDLVKVGEPNELLVGVKARHLFDVNGRTPYGWGSFWGEMARGIWQDVYLIARNKLRVADVFVQPSVTRHELTVQTTVTNETGQAWEGALQQGAWNATEFDQPGQGPAHTLPPVQVSLAPGEIKTVSVTSPWPDATLWWPANSGEGRGPHLYVLGSTLASRDDQMPRDEHCVRFGFKEFGLDPAGGRKFLLNGVPFSGRGDAWHFMGVPQLTPAYARAWYEMAFSANVNIIRLHAQVYPEYYLEVADEMGMLIVDESALWGSAINFWYNDDFLRRAADHVRELVLRDRNHPSVALWSVANEIYARQGNDNAPSQDWIFARYAEWAAQMKALDPTREVSSDGDNDLGGRLPIYSFHYAGPGDPGVKKTSTIGEAGSMYYSTPAEVAHAIGDRAYRTYTDRQEALGVETADLIEGHRRWAAYTMPFNIAWYGLEPLPMNVNFTYDDLSAPGTKPDRLGPYCTTLNGGRDPKLPAFVPTALYHAEKDAFVPVRFFVKERTALFWERQKVVRHLTVHNDILDPSDLTLEWVLRGRGGRLASYAGSHGTLAVGREKLSLKPGEMRELTLTIAMPEVTQGSSLLTVFDARLLRNGKECFRQKLEWTLFEEPNPAAMEQFEQQGGSIAIYDPKGLTAAVLKSVGARLRVVEKPEGLLEEAAMISVVGANSGISHEAARKLYEEAGPLVVYEGNPGFYGEDMPATLRPGRHVRAFNQDLIGPKYFVNEWLQFWGEDGVVARGACGRQVHGNVHPLITCGDGELAAFIAWKGDKPRTFCELLVSEKGMQETAAASVAVAVLALGLSEPPPFLDSTAVVAEPRSRFAATLAAVGVQEQAENPSTLLCDASVPPADPEGIRRFVDTEGYRQRLVLFGLTPESLEAWNALLPVKLALEATDAVQLIRADDEADLTLGIDHHDLFWIEQNNTRRIMDWGVSTEAEGAEALLVTNHTDWRRWCWQGENVKTSALVRSEREPFVRRTGLLEVPCGEATLVVSQVRLDPTNPKSMGYHSQLMTNLSVPLRSGAATDLDMTPFNVDADGFIQAWLTCGPFSADDPHQTDFIPGGEASLTPEPGTVSGGGIWRAYRSGGPILDFTRPELFGKLANSAAYAAAWVYSPRLTIANLWLGSDDSVKVWINGTQVHSLAAGRPVAPDSDKVSGVTLREGWSCVVFKVSQGTGEWGLCARFVDSAGRPIEGLRVSTAPQVTARVALSREGWTATTSDPGEDPARAFDDSATTRWTTGQAMGPGMWYRLDLGRSETVTQIVLDAAASPGDFPRGLKVEASEDGEAWRTVADCPVTSPAQQGGVLSLVITPTSLRYLRLTQTGPVGCAPGLYWSIHDLRLLN